MVGERVVAYSYLTSPVTPEGELVSLRRDPEVGKQKQPRNRGHPN